MHVVYIMNNDIYTNCNCNRAAPAFGILDMLLN